MFYLLNAPNLILQMLWQDFKSEENTFFILIRMEHTRPQTIISDSSWNFHNPRIFMYYHRDSQTCTESSLCEEGVGCWGASEAQSLCYVCPITTTQAPKISQGKCMPQKKCTLFSNMYFQFHYEEENKMLPCTCQNSRLYRMFWRGKKQEVQ